MNILSRVKKEMCGKSGTREPGNVELKASDVAVYLLLSVS